MNLKMKGITKSFGANNVLQGIDFTLSGGEICALLVKMDRKIHTYEYTGGVLKADRERFPLMTGWLNLRLRWIP